MSAPITPTLYNCLTRIINRRGTYTPDDAKAFGDTATLNRLIRAGLVINLATMALPEPRYDISPAGRTARANYENAEHPPTLFDLRPFTP